MNQDVTLLVAGYPVFYPFLFHGLKPRLVLQRVLPDAQHRVVVFSRVPAIVDSMEMHIVAALIIEHC